MASVALVNVSVFGFRGRNYLPLRRIIGGYFDVEGSVISFPLLILRRLVRPNEYLDIVESVLFLFCGDKGMSTVGGGDGLLGFSNIFRSSFLRVCLIL
jgi:hypothetical protein